MSDVLETNSDKNFVLGHRERLRQRFLQSGISAMADYEVIELFLTLCIPRIDVKPIAKNMLNRFGSIRGILNASDSELLSIKGIGQSAICSIKILRLCIESNHKENIADVSESIDSVDKLMKFFEARIASLPYEVLEMLCFDSQLKLLGIGAVRLFEGSVNSANVDIRKILEIAIKNSASSIVLAHNHPSGNCTPSTDDLRFTKSLSLACRPLRVDFIEHIIVGKNGCFSFRKDGQLDKLYDPTISVGTYKDAVAMNKVILK